MGGFSRYAVVTGANKGIGLEIARQLASQGVTVVLTARNDNRGKEATSKLQELGLLNLVFHQLDVLDPVGIQSLAKFLGEKFGRLDILVRNDLFVGRFSSFRSNYGFVRWFLDFYIVLPSPSLGICFSPFPCFSCPAIFSRGLPKLMIGSYVISSQVNNAGAGEVR